MGFRAVAGKYRSFGRTAGEALEALLTQENGHIESSAILIQRYAPDAFFTFAQYERMQELFSRASLSTAEKKELTALVDAELNATVKRLDSLTEATTQ